MTDNISSIDAISAREIAYLHNIEEDKEKLNNIFQQIQSAANKGKYCTTLINDASNLTDEMKKYITDRGFKLEHSTEVISGIPCSYTRISW